QRVYKYLKQPYCQRWIWCEFMESFVDKALLACAYDIHSYMHACFPQLQTRQLPRRAWQLIRRSMGKARRFSPAFIDAERIELERLRCLLRQLQQRSFNLEQDGELLALMPKFVPQALAVDTKVISLLHLPLLSLYKGCIVDFDPKDSSYLVKFDYNGQQMLLRLPDCLLCTLHEGKTLPLASIMQKSDDSDPAQLSSFESSIGSSEQLLDALLKLQKLLQVKRKTVDDMASMNEELEASGMQLPARRETRLTPQREKLQRRYATNMIMLHRVNVDILEPLHVVHTHLSEHESNAQHRKHVSRNELYENCRTLAELDLKAASLKPESEATRELVLRLQTLLYLCSELGNGNNVELDAIMDDFLSNLLDSYPSQLRDAIGGIIGLLQPLREHIVTLSRKEAERCEVVLQ
ncbi:aly, partial [Drosophila busckii]